MISFIKKRVWYGLGTLLMVVTITFFLMHALPGNPFETGKAMNPEIKAHLFEKYHLNEPVWKQYLYYIQTLLHGDLGESMMIRGRKVTQIILQHFPYSMLVGILGMIFAMVNGVVLGVVAAIYRGKLRDKMGMLLAIIGLSIPNFIIAGFLQWFTSQISILTGVDLFPIAGYENFNAYILPSIALGIIPMAIIARMSRSTMIEVLGQDYIRTAKAKGVPTITIIYRHVLRNALLPCISYLGILLAGMVTGSFLIESLFSIPGLGYYYIQTLENNDYTCVLGLTIFYSLILILLMIGSDLLTMMLDPRIRVKK